jgi:ABC-type transport system involved in multi-copper enzyme maturation permease subunit
MIFTLSGLTIKEYYRRKVLIVLFLMMLVVAGSGLLSNPFTMGIQGQLMRDLSLLFIEWFGVFFSLALASTFLPNEIERKVLYPFLSRGISRGKYLWGKFLGISSILAFFNLILGLELMLVVKISIGAAHPLILGACFLFWVQDMVIVGFSIFFSTFMTAPVSFASMVLLYILGDISHFYVEAFTSGNPIVNFLLLKVKSLLPYFDYFSIRAAVTHNYSVSFSYIGAAALYGALYIVLAMLFAESVFLKKDL